MPSSHSAFHVAALPLDFHGLSSWNIHSISDHATGHTPDLIPDGLSFTGHIHSKAGGPFRCMHSLQILCSGLWPCVMRGLQVHCGQGSAVAPVLASVSIVSMVMRFLTHSTIAMQVARACTSVV